MTADRPEAPISKRCVTLTALRPYFFICDREVLHKLCTQCVESCVKYGLYTVCRGVYTSCVLMDSEFKVLVSRFSTHPPTGDRCVEVLSRTRAMCYIYIYICVAVAHIHGFQPV